ncbi:MAG: cytochrome C oxidase subunit IV family protein [Anaerolineae bacterium]|nr:cytochrome C oxidase subunit IV family protein [Anaerolineae bacterium]
MTDMSTTTQAEELAQEAHDSHSADHSDKTVLFGTTINAPVYTVVFGALGALTLFELLIAELFPRNFLTTGLLVIASIIKAVLVVLFYMHLKDDNPLYALALVVPLGIGLIAAFFLLAVPVTGY